MRRSSAYKAPKSKSRLASKKKHTREVDADYIAAVRALEGTVPGRVTRKYRRRNEERARSRQAELRRGERMQNGDKWGNTWYRRHRFLENMIERSERDLRVKRMKLGLLSAGSLASDSIGDVRSARWTWAAMRLAYVVGTYRLETYMRSSRAGQAGTHSSTPTT